MSSSFAFWALVVCAVMCAVALSAAALVAYSKAAGASAAMRDERAARDEAEAAAKFAIARWEEAERKGESFRLLTSGILTERDKWQILYHTQSHEHGNAQALMMAAIEHLSRRLEALGHKIEIPPVLREIQEGFREKHMNPSSLEDGQPMGKLGSNKTAAAVTASSAQPQSESENTAQ